MTAQRLHSLFGAHTATSSPPKRLSVSGRRLLLPDGSPWYGIGMDGFTTLQDWLTNKPKADALIAYMVAHQVEFLRVFGMYNGGIGRFIPAENPDYFDGLKALATILRDKGKRLYFTTNADCQNAPLTFDPSFYDRVCDVLRPFADSVLSDFGNEWPFNGFDPKRGHKPAGLISGAGSVGGGYQPLHDPLWDFAQWQGGRDDDFERKYKDVRDQYMGDNTTGNPGDPPAFAFQCPIIEDETIGLGEAYESGRTTNSPYKVWQYVAGSKLMGAAATVLHNRSGIFGNLPLAGGLEEQCLDAGVAASQLPLGRNAFARYERGNSPDQPQNPNLPILHFDIEPSPSIGYPGNPNGSLRTHAMIDGNYAEVIAPGAGPGYVATAANGWRIVKSYGLPGHPANVLICER